MKYYVTADVHGFYTELHRALDRAGYFADPEPHKLLILGDLFDRGQEAGGRFRYRADWREAAPEDWREARWTNGMNAAPFCLEKKTILCGHWHCSYGHAVYEHRGTEFGTDADFSPYYGPGIVALDACTAHSGRVNVVILREE